MRIQSTSRDRANLASLKAGNRGCNTTTVIFVCSRNILEFANFLRKFVMTHLGYFLIWVVKQNFLRKFWSMRLQRWNTRMCVTIILSNRNTRNDGKLLNYKRNCTYIRRIPHIEKKRWATHTFQTFKRTGCASNGSLLLFI